MRGKTGRRLPFLGAALALVLLGTAPASAAETEPVSPRAETLIPVGRAVGVKLFSDGVMVVGFSRIPQEAGAVVPARACGLKEGDIITHINAAEVDTIEEVQAQLEQIGGEEMSIRAIRRGEPVEVTAQAVRCSTDGSYKLGAWLRDSMAGIGTVTWYDPDSGAFGALGHGINDVDTAQLMPLEHGGVLGATVADVKRGEKGAPGELHGSFQQDRELGTLRANTARGIFGRLTDGSMAKGLRALPVADRSQLQVGPAVIRSNIAGDEVGEYQVEITRLLTGGEEGRDMMLRVTDPDLLAATGGIVQGMSGSPIIQNGSLVGAVTHVLVNDPTRGYGIFIENMLAAGA